MRLWQRLPVVWRWLGLTLAVLLLHLWLLGSLPLNLQTGDDTQPKSLQFATRTVTDPQPAKPTPAPAIVKEQTKPRAKAAPAPTVAAQPADLPLPASNSASISPEPAASDPVAEPAPDIAPVASAPEAPAPSASAAEAATLVVDAVGPPPKEPSFKVNGEALSTSTRLLYRVETSRFPYLLSGELLWRNEGDRYQALLRYSAFGQARTQTSRGRITAQGLTPERFSDKFRSEVAAHFNYTQGKVTFSANTPDAPLLAGAQDRLSVLIQLGGFLASNPDQILSDSTLTIQTVGGRAADVWLFTVVTTEPLALPGGALDGIKLERLPRELYDQKVEVWLSPQLGYLPARIRITETNGERIDQLWQATEPVEADTTLPNPPPAKPGH